MRIKIKTYIRRIIFFPIVIPFIPFIWILFEGSMKDIWKDILNMTDEDTDTDGGLM